MSFDRKQYHFKYGSDDPENQYIRLFPPKLSDFPTFVIIHGGFWKIMYSLDNAMIDTMQPFLSNQGYGVCLIEYRRVGHVGGGYPGTNEDILQAMRSLYTFSKKNDLKIDFDKVIIMGHSAGGTLALWTCCHLVDRQLPFTPCLCVALAPVGDLETGYTRRLSDEGDAVEKYMGVPPASSASSTILENCKYKEASPHHMLPLQVPTLLVSGDRDDCVPADMVKTFYELAKASAASSSVVLNSTASNNSNNEIDDIKPVEVKLLELTACDHLQMLNTNDVNWMEIWSCVWSMLPAPPSPLSSS